MQEENHPNLFFGLEVSAPWPDPLPKGRIVPKDGRHLTLAFLGKVDPKKILSELKSFHPSSSALGAAGVCDELLFLPETRPRVVAYNVSWLTQKVELLSFRQSLFDWLVHLGYPLDERPFLSHVTLARAPFDKKQWSTHFSKLPLIVHNIHLYQSKGNLTYEPLWTTPLTLPFEELSHTGDVAYIVRGHSLNEISLHAQLALAFEHPPFLSYVGAEEPPHSLEKVIMLLNEKIAHLDQESGSPFKAVSFHGELKQKDNLYTWEMIVDV